jgi:hypothetical protein
MDQVPRNLIGYMQVQFKIFENGEIYDSFGINAYDDCFETNRELVSSHHQVVDDKAKVYDKIFEIKLNFNKTGSRVIMHTPIHQSEDWEFLMKHQGFKIFFYCILGSTP